MANNLPKESDFPKEKVFDKEIDPNMQLASKLEKVTYAAHNQMRATPEIFVPDVESQIKNFVPGTNRLIRPGRNPLMTQEGIQCWYEGRRALNDQGALNELEWSDGLALAA